MRPSTGKAQVLVGVMICVVAGWLGRIPAASADCLSCFEHAKCPPPQCLNWCAQWVDQDGDGLGDTCPCVSANGWIRCWVILGPFAGNNLDDHISGGCGYTERNIEPSWGNLTQDKVWEFISAPATGSLAGVVNIRTFKSQFNQDDQNAYLHTYIYNPSERTVRARVGSSGMFSLYIDGSELIADNGTDPFRFDSDADRTRAADQDISYPFTLTKGWHRIMAHVANHVTDWSFMLRFDDGDVNILDGDDLYVTALRAQIPAHQGLIVPEALEARPPAVVDWLILGGPSQGPFDGEGEAAECGKLPENCMADCVNDRDVYDDAVTGETEQQDVAPTVNHTVQGTNRTWTWTNLRRPATASMIDFTAHRHLLDFNRFYGFNGTTTGLNKVVYLHTYCINHAAPVRAQVLVGAADCAQVWVNGTRVYQKCADDTTVSCVQGPSRTFVLNSGVNRILLRVDQASGSWSGTLSVVADNSIMVLPNVEFTPAPPPGPSDCDGDSDSDEDEITNEESPDYNQNGIPDQCEIVNASILDCNNNQALDVVDIQSGISTDHNQNGIPDECEIAATTSNDCNGDDIPDEAQMVDCNGNGILDECEISANPSLDCDDDGIPDACQTTLPLGLYVGTQGGLQNGGNAKVWHYSLFNELWTDLTPAGFGGSTENVSAVMDLAYFQGHLYAAIQTRPGRGGDGGLGQVWRYVGDGVWSKVGNALDDTSADTYATSVMTLNVFQGKLYASVSKDCFQCGYSSAMGVYRWDPDQPSPEWERMTWQSGTGFRSATVTALCGRPQLFLGELNTDNIWRYDEISGGEEGLIKLIAPQSGSCIWDLAEYDSQLYAGSYGSLFYQSAANFGCDDATITFTTISPSGMTAAEEWALAVFRNKLYVGLGGTPGADGCQLHAYDGDEWNKIGPLSDNKWPTTSTYGEGISALAAYGDKYLFLGTGVPDGYNFTANGEGSVYRMRINEEETEEFELISPTDMFGGGVQSMLTVTTADCNANGIPDTCDIRDCPSGTWECGDQNEDGFPDGCQGSPPTAQIVIWPEPGDRYECRTIYMDGSGSQSSNPSVPLRFEWRVDTNPVTGSPASQDILIFKDVDLEYAWTQDGEYQVTLRVYQDWMWREATETVIIKDLDPRVALTGPEILKVNQKGCFIGYVTAGCDLLDSGGPQWQILDKNGSPIQDVTLSTHDNLDTARLITFTSVPDAQVQPLRVVIAIKEAGSSTWVEASTQVVVIDDGEGLVINQKHLAVTSIYHTYEKDGDYIKHRSTLRVTNTGTTNISEPIRLAFDNLQPETTDLVGAEGLQDNRPYITLRDGSGTPIGIQGGSWADVDVCWEVSWPQPSSADDFAFNVHAYAHQLPPKFTSQPVEHAREGDLYVYAAQAEDPEGDSLFFAIDRSNLDTPSDLYIHPTTGVIHWLVGKEVSNLNVPVTIQVSDGHEIVEDSYVIAVERVNFPPRFTKLPVTTGEAGVEYSYPPMIDPAGLVEDPDGHGYVISFLEKPAGMDLHSSQERVVWEEPVVGTHWVTLKVEDDGLPSPLWTFQTSPLHIVACQNPPQITRVEHDPEFLSSTPVQEGIPFAYQIKASPGASSQVLSYHLDQGPQGLRISPKGVIEWTPSFTSHGKWPVRVLVFSGIAGCYSAETFLLEVNDRNSPPRITSSPLTSAREGEVYSYPVRHEDLDRDEVTFSLAGTYLTDGRYVHPPKDMQIHPRNGQILWVPSQTAARGGPDENGAYPITVLVTDPAQEFDSQSFTITVEAVDLPPVVNSYPIDLVLEGEEYSYQIEAVEPDGQFMNYVLVRTIPAVSGFSVGQTTGLVTWEVPDGASYDSPYYVELGVKDCDQPDCSGDDGRMTPHEYWLWALPKNPNNRRPELVHAPSVNAAIEDEIFAYSFTIKDEDEAVTPNNESLTASLISTLPALEQPTVALSSPDGNGVRTCTVTWDTPTTSHVTIPASGEELDPYEFKVRIEDSSKARLELTLWVHVYPADFDNQPPRIVSDPNHAATVGEPYVYTVHAVDDQTPLADLEFDLVPVPEGGEEGGMLIAPPTGMQVIKTTEGQETIVKVVWNQPMRDNLGLYWVGVRVTDGAGAWYTQAYTLNVSMAGGNHIPKITSEPIQLARANPVNQPQAFLWEYVITVEDEDFQDTHVLTLEKAPAGVTINPTQGIVRWYPTMLQITSHDFIVRVTDSQGAWYEQHFSVAVSVNGENAPPEITSKPTSYSVQASQTYSYEVLVKDAGPAEDDWLFTLEEGPAGMTLTRDQPAPTGYQAKALLSWSTAAATPEGTYTVRVRVTDLDSAYYEQTFPVTVYTGNEENHRPRIVSRPSPRAQVGVLYTFSIRFIDEDSGDTHTITLEKAPAGAITEDDPEYTPDGKRIEWTPNINQIGARDFIVRVTDDHGAWEELHFTVTVSRDGENNAPTIHSDPPQLVEQGTVYQYLLDARDQDPGDVLAYSLVDPPSGMVFDSIQKNLVVWNTTGAQIKTHRIKVRATDRNGAYIQQEYDLTVSTDGKNRPPRILSKPPETFAYHDPNEWYIYCIDVVDPDGDQLTYSANYPEELDSYVAWDDAPCGTRKGFNIIFDQTHDGQTFPITIRVTDAHGASTEQSFSITVSEYGDNKAPRIVSEPIRHVVAGDIYRYTVVALDDASGLTFGWGDSFTPPTGMTLNDDQGTGDAPGLVKWQVPVEQPVGVHPIIIKVTDAQGARTTQSYDLYVVQNQGPTIASSPVTNSIVGYKYSYAVKAVDPDSETLFYYVDDPSENFSMGETTGVLEWDSPTAPDVGTYPLTATVRDRQVGQPAEEATQQFTVTVRTPQEGDRVPPDIEVTVQPEYVDVTSTAQTVTITVTVRDDTVITATTLEVKDPSEEILGTCTSLVDGVATCEVPAESPGTYKVTATATDIGTKTSTATTEFSAFDTTDAGPPIVDIANLEGSGGMPVNLPNFDSLPAEPTDKDYKSPIVGTVKDIGTGIYKYTLSYKRVDRPDSEYVVFATAYAALGDPTPAELGRLDTTLLPNGLYDIRLMAWDRIGNSAHIEKTVSVTGDFKVGNFSMTFADLDVPIANLPIVVSRTYDSRNKFSGDFGFGWTLDLTTVTLEESESLGTDWSLVPSPNYFGSCMVVPNGPHTVTITWPDGRVHRFAAVSGLPQNIGCGTGGSGFSNLRNFSTIVFDRIEPANSTAALAVLNKPTMFNATYGWWLSTGEDFTEPRNPYDPVSYRFTDDDGTVYTFTGRPRSRTATLTEIKQRDGTIVQFNSDGSGIVVTVPGDNGTPIASGGVSFHRDSRGRIYKIVGPDQTPILYSYDDRGDLVSMTDREGSVVQFKYNISHGLTEIIDPRGVSVARNVYNEHEQLVGQVDADGNYIEFTHPPGIFQDTINDQSITLRREVVTTTPGQSVFYDYDLKGKVRRTEQGVTLVPGQPPQSVITQYDYDPSGNRIWTKDAEGRESRQEQFDVLGNPGKVTDVNGFVTETTYLNGKPTRISLPQHGQVTSTTPATINEYEQDRLKSTTDPEGNVTQFQYGPGGLLKSRLDAENNLTQYEYDTAGRLAHEMNAMGGTKSYIYDSNGNVLSARYTWTPLGETPREMVAPSEYDGQGRVVRQVDVLGNQTIFTYNVLGKQHTVTDPRGYTIVNEYDLRGNLTKTTHADDSTTEYGYDREGRGIWTKDRDGRVTNNKFDELGRLIATYHPDGTALEFDGPHTRTIYDKIGRVVERRDERYDWDDPRNTAYQHPIVTHSYPHDPSQSYTVSKVIVTDENGTYETVSKSDARGNAMETIDGKGHKREFAYDLNGRPTKTTFVFDDTSKNTTIEVTYDKLGRKIAEKDQAGHVTQFEYDPLGRLTSVTDHRGGQTKYQYDELGNLICQTDAETHSTWMAYDALGRLTARILPSGQTESFGYDAVGNRTSHTDFAQRTTTFDYNSDNRLTLKKLPYSLFAAVLDSTAGRAIIRFEMNTAMTAVTVAYSHNIENVTDVAVEELDGTPVTSLGALASPAVWSIGEADRDALLASEYRLNIKTTSQPTGAVSGMINAMPSQIEYDYTPAGLRTKAGGDTYEYNARGLLWKEFKADGSVIEYEYEPTGNRSSMTVTPPNSGSPFRIEYRYDRLNRLKNVIDVNDPEEPNDDDVTTYAYDEVGNLETVTYGNGTITEYEYDEQNRLTTITFKLNSTTVYRQYKYTLGLSGNRTRVDEYSDAGQTLVRAVDYGYDELYRLIREREYDSSGTNVVREVGYQYDGVGNRKMMTKTADGYLLTVEYGYDSNDRLLQRTETLTQLGEGFAARALKAAERRADAGVRARNVLIGFALLSVSALLVPLAFLRRRPNEGGAVRWRRVRLGIIGLGMAPLMAVGPEQVHALHVQHVQAPLRSAVAAAVLAQSSPEPITYTYGYDANGNMTAETKLDASGSVVAVNSFLYDTQNRLVQASMRTGTVPHDESYTYDVDGSRASKTVDGVTTYFMTDKSGGLPQVVAELNVSRVLTVRYVRGHNLIAQVRAAGRSYYHYDGQMSTRHLTDAPADPVATPPEITDSYTYDAFGGLQPGNSDPENAAFLYTGEQLDANTGFYYLRARYYDTLNGRFTALDPFTGNASEPHTLHRYLYANANPVMNSDPTGLFSLGSFIATTGLRAMLGRLLLSQLKSPQHYIGSAMLNTFAGQWYSKWINKLDAEPTIMIGFDAMIGMGFNFFSLSAGASAEFIWSPDFGWAGYSAANYISLAFLPPISRSVVDTFTIKAGMIFGIASKGDYLDDSVSVSLPLSGLPARLRDKMLSRGDLFIQLLQRAIAGLPGLTAAAARWTPLITLLQDAASQASAYVSWLIDRFSEWRRDDRSSSVNVFCDWTDGTPFGFAFSYGVSTAGSASVTLAKYYRLF